MRLKKHVYQWLGVTLIFLGLCVTFIWGKRVASTLYALKGNMDYIQNALTVDNPLTINADEITEVVYSTRENVVQLQSDTRFLLRMTPLLSWMPKVGPLLKELPDLMTLADVGTQTVVEIWTLAQPAFVQIQDQGMSIPILITLLDEINSESVTLQKSADILNTTYQAIDPEVIPWRYRQLFVKIGPYLAMYANGLPLLDDIPELIGVGEPSTFLVLALNEDELRGGGGFISGAGELVLNDGKIASMEFRDSYSADDYTLPYPEPPAPFTQFMAIDLWVFRDSNWSPDFPTAVRQAIALYRPAEPVDIKGVVALDQYTAEKIVDAVGPLLLPGSDLAVTGDTLVDYIRNAWSPGTEEFQMGWWLEHKSFMGEITQAILNKIDIGAVDWTSLYQIGMQLVEERHIQIYVENKDVETFLRKLHWDSTLEIPPQDGFLFVESNVGYNKVSTRIDRQVTYSVDLTKSPPTADVILNLQHKSQNELNCMPEVKYFATYEESMERCYWTYLRFYVPEGAQLLEASQHPIDSNRVLTGQSWPGIVKISRAEEGPFVMFEQAILLSPASSVDIHLTYNLPMSVLRMIDENTFAYRLTLQKQAGLRVIPTQVILRVPDNALISNAYPEAHELEPGVFAYDINLQKTTEVELYYTVVGKKGSD